MSNFLSIPQFANRIGISRIAVFKQIKKGKLKAIRIGRNWAIEEKELDKYIYKKKNNKTYLNLKEINLDKQKQVNSKKLQQKSHQLFNKSDIEDIGWD
ncbi:MAG: helix-turn-helix domain-containing protein [Elusimicrobiales bacterium]|nr:helix-turn-helix domain-containing protein [Elusimicrobiales bacterium]